MTDRNLSVAVIFGSARTPRFCDIVGRWVLDRLDATPGISYETIDPRELDLPHGHTPGAASVQTLRTSLEAADAFIVITPEYNHSYPGALKILIDSASDGWGAKPVAFISYGGVSGGLRAVEHLRPVFAELHAVTIRDSVSLSNPWNRVGKDGRLDAGPAALAAFDTMAGRLGWWARALKQARAEAPYKEAA